MEFKNIFLGLGVVLVLVVSMFGFLDAINSEYDSDVGVGLNGTRGNVQTLLEKNLLNESFEYAQSTQPQAGAESQQGEDNLISRALNSIGLVDDLLGIIPALMKDAGEALNIPQIYIRIAEALFWIIFSLTLAYLLLLGIRRVLG